MLDWFNEIKYRKEEYEEKTKKEEITKKSSKTLLNTLVYSISR